jgi:hypothetical protein
MISVNSFQNSIFDPINSNKNKYLNHTVFDNQYIKYIVTQKQTNLIDLINQIMIDINADIEKINENFTVILIDEIINGSFREKNLNKIFEENGCYTQSDFISFEEFEFYYQELTETNSFVVSKYNELEYLHGVLEDALRNNNHNYTGTTLQEIIETGISYSIESLYLSNGAKSVTIYNTFLEITNTFDEMKNVV